jgi:GxxExxY protein
VTERIIGCAYDVHNELGCGFLEKVYENALALELGQRGIDAEQQKEVVVYYRGNLVGRFCADVLVEGTVLVEIKAANGIDDVHMAQCLNYLRATGLPLCLLLNFGNPKLQIKRLAGFPSRGI